MAFGTNTINVTTSATLIIAANTNQKKRNLKNVGSETVFVGSDNSVTVADGFPVLPQEELNFGDFNGTLYGIVTTSDADVDITEDQ